METKITKSVTNYSDFEDIRPYHQSEFAEAWKRITTEPTFFAALKYLFPEEENKKIVAELNQINSTKEFQLRVMHHAIRNIIKQSSAGLTCSGFENIDAQKSYLYISNHRDIFLDSGILQILLVEHEHDTTEITFGSNLMINQFITDVGKANKMFTVYRGGTRRELYENSLRLSNYIRHTITEKKQSAWIAQRNGRTKNGADETQVGLLKMLASSGTTNFENTFHELNIIPVSISYEFEPCDAFKVHENYVSQTTPYVKSPGEDLQSILAGVTQPKGRIHLALGKPINNSLREIADSQDNFKTLTQTIDTEIFNNYKLFPANYIAFDLLNSNNSHNSNYSEIEKDFFVNYMNKKLATLQGEKEILRKLFLELYANPVKSANK